jgi:vancomycin resistance protein YoaR
MLALSVGIIFLNCGFSARLPRGVIINGTDVGGLNYITAKNKLRQAQIERLKGVSLRIYGGECQYLFTYPEINFSDNFTEDIKKIEGSGEYFSNVTVYLNGIDEVICGICRDIERDVKEPCAEFLKNSGTFFYDEGNDGVKIDKEKLKADINKSINSDFADVEITTTKTNRVGSMAELLKNTKPLIRFTTYFDGQNKGRCHNIKLAAEKINGSIIGAGETFSFNNTVGERSVKNGFMRAKIIEEGKFVEGIGGGVCQVSTTLYNAALLSGLEIKEYHPHSLKVGYVPLSRDAMVSGNYFDLKIKNVSLTPIYVAMNVGDGCISCTIFGRGDGWKYSILSQEICGEEESGSEVKSESYLIMEKGGKVVKKFIRRDRYGVGG